MSFTCGSFVPRCGRGGGGGGSGGNQQAFSYRVTGAEPDLAALVIPLPAPRASANYMVTCTQSDNTNYLSHHVDAGDRTVAQFVLRLSAPATVGDLFWFFVTDLL